MKNRGVLQKENSASRPCAIRIVLSGLLLIAVELMHSVDHRHDILYRGAALHDVDGVEDVAAVGREDLQTPSRSCRSARRKRCASRYSSVWRSSRLTAATSLTRFILYSAAPR